jgi:hypothetical protein
MDGILAPIQSSVRGAFLFSQQTFRLGGQFQERR